MPFDLSPGLKVNGEALALQWLDALRAVRVDLALGLTGRAVLRLVDDGYALSSSGVFELGAEVAITAGGQPVFTGEVTATALEQSTSRLPDLVVTVDDRAARLAVATHNRALLQQSLDDLVGKLAVEAGMTYSRSIGSTPKPYWLQVGTNLEFLDQLCARAGLVWWVEDGAKLRVAAVDATDGTATLRLGTDLDSFSVRATTTAPESVTVRGWNPDQQQVVAGTWDTKVASESAFVGGAAGRKASSRGSMTVAVATPSPVDADEAKVFAKAKFSEASSAAVVATGKGAVNPALRLTNRVTVEDAGPASGRYTVTRIEHTLTGAGFETKFTAGPVRPSGMVDLLRGSRPSSGLEVAGVYTAVVSDMKDPDSKGRVKVTWQVVADQVESAWGRIVTLGAGKSRGMVFLPEIGDEVLIAFEHGDTRRPIVLGGLFSSVNTRPTTDDLDQNRVKFRRITSRLGHVVELADGTQPAEQHILLSLAGRKHKIRLGADEIDVISDGTPIKLTNGQATVTLAKNGDITLDGNNIELKAKAEVKISAGTRATVKGNAGASLLGAQVQVKGDGTASLEAGGATTVKGATVAIN